MYLWNTNALAKELKEDTLPEREKFKYLMIYILLGVVGFELLKYLPEEVSQSVVSQTNVSESTVLMSIFNILVVTIGIYLCYETNSRGDGVKFIERYICLSLPLWIRITVLWMVSYLVLGIVLIIAIRAVDMDSDLSGARNMLKLLLDIITSILYYWRLNVHIKSISHNETGVVPA